jgi:hypothetical protein
LLDPENVSISLVTIARAADVLGKRIEVRMEDVKAKRVASGARAARASV